MLLSEVHAGSIYVVASLSGRWGIRRKLVDMGIDNGAKIKIKRIDNESIHFTINGHIRLRKLPLVYAPFVTVVSADAEDLSTQIEGICNVIPVVSFGDETILQEIFDFKPEVLKETKVHHSNHDIIFTHLPKTTSISGCSSEEKAIRELITSKYPDLVVGVIDATDLENQLYLASFFIGMDVKMMLILNNIDVLTEKGQKLDYEHLGKMLGTPILAYNGEQDKDIIIRTLLNIHHNTEPFVRHIHINFGTTLERAISKVKKHIKKDMQLSEEIAPRYTALRLLEGDANVMKSISYHTRCEKRQCVINTEVSRVERLFGSDIKDVIHEARLAYIKGGIKENLNAIGSTRSQLAGKKVDKILTHKRWGIPIFFAFIFITFFVTFEIGKYPSEWLESGVLLLGNYLNGIMEEGAFKSLIIDGVIGGVGGILVYLPNIFILFFFIGLLETSGYLSRGAFLVDKYMHRIGLHGKSFIPLIMGFGCTVPAVMATRMLDDRKNRIVTMLILPFMSCSAKLPVYVLLIAAFFPSNPTLVLVSLYLIGIIFAIITAFIFNKTLFRKKEIPYVMQLPPYRKPSGRLLMHFTWIRGREYLKKIAGIILIASVIIWALGYFPREVNYSQDYDALIAQVEKTDPTEARILELTKEAERHQQSYIGKLGNFIQPVMSPLGFDWKMSISVLTGIAGKEIVVSTMGVLYQATEESGESAESLPVKLRGEKYHSGPRIGEPVYTKVSAYAFLMFILLYFPCMGVVVAVWKESERFKWSLFTILYTTGLAWVMSFIIYQVGTALFG
ncbi:MAG: ferrous iron transport protein B [Bacteroidales bacterium]|nr:ferrous iron transport protein B [Bacteroidales bacterium]